MSADQAPGWYPDPGGQPATQRWWDGGTWSPVTRPAPAGTGPAPRMRPSAADIRAAKPTSTPDGAVLAGLIPRMVARVLDWVLVSIVSFAAAYPLLKTVISAYQAWLDEALLSVQRGTPVPPLTILQDVEAQASMRSYLLISVLVSGIYTVSMLKLWGATLGKLLLRVRVRPWQGAGRLSWGQAVGRWVVGDAVGTVFVFFLMINFLWPIWDQRRQALHDKLPGTVVVRSGGPVGSVPPGPPAPGAAPWP